MKLKLNFNIEDELILPQNYNHILQATILNWINDEKYQEFMHDKGYSYNNRVFKLFSFSKIYGKFTLNRANKKIEFYEKVTIYISAVDHEFLNYVGNNLLMNQDLKIYNQNIKLESFEVIKEEIKEEMVVYTLSPITVYSTVEILGRKKTYYYNPYEKEFSILIRENLIKKYISYYEIEPENTYLEIVSYNKKIKQSILNYKGFIIKGWNGEFVLKGSKELIDMALSSGLGSKNSQGFGCIKLKEF